MAERKRMEQDERAEALQLLVQGYSHGAVARKLGFSQQLISRIAAQEGVPIVNDIQRNLKLAKTVYKLDQRLALLDRAFDKLGELLDQITTTRDMYPWSLSMGILVDKRRLEEGEVTSRHETVSTDDTRNRLLAQLSRQTVLPNQDTGEPAQPN